jgi:hypothetical protein
VRTRSGKSTTPFCFFGTARRFARATKVSFSRFGTSLVDSDGLRCITFPASSTFNASFCSSSGSLTDDRRDPGGEPPTDDRRDPGGLAPIAICACGTQGGIITFDPPAPLDSGKSMMLPLAADMGAIRVAGFFLLFLILRTRAAMDAHEPDEHVGIVIVLVFI